MIQVTVRYFAVLREIKGQDQQIVQVPEGATLGAIYQQLFQGPESALPVGYARNTEYASADTVVADGDEIAFLPPLGGGQ